MLPSSEVRIGNTRTKATPFSEQCQEWCREAVKPWPRLQSFVGQMIDRMRIRELGGRVQLELPEDLQAIAELAYWQAQWVLGMGPAQLCDNTVPVARACLAFLFAGELHQRALSPEIREVFEELLEFTQLIETTLLTGTHGCIKSLQLERLADSMYQSCQRLTRPVYLTTDQ